MTTTPASRRPTGGALLPLLLLLATGLALAAVVVAVNRNRSTSTGERVQSSGAAAVSPAPPALVTSTAASTEPIVYLVDSAEEAARIQAPHPGEPRLPDTARVMVAGTDGDLLDIERAVAEADSVRAGLNLPPTRVVDLRGISPRPATPAAPTPDCWVSDARVC